MALTEYSSLTKTELREKLSDLTPEEVQSLKEEMGLKAFRQIFNEESQVDSSPGGPKQRANKNRPMEVSSKRKVHAVPDSSGAKKQFVPRDPRFDELSGKFRQGVFNRDYAFLADVRARDKQKVQKQLKKEKNDKKKEKLKEVLTRMQQEEQRREEKERKETALKQWKEKEKDRVKDGKKPYFLKKSDKHKLELAEKYKALKKKGDAHLHKTLAKKNKRNAGKQKKKLQLI